MTSSKASNPLKITDTTLRDAHQSLAATRMRTSEMEPIAPEVDKAGFWSAEVWGGATFDVATRFLAEDPWERVRVLKRLMPNTPLQMLLRGQNLVGYRNYADDVVTAFVHHAADEGIDVFRVFDAVNDERNFETAVKAIKDRGKHFQACICYSVTESHLGGPVFNLDYFVNKAKVLRDMGADTLCIKDMAGLLAPYDAYDLVKALKENISIPIQLHTHYTSGMASMTVLKAVEAGLDIVDTCMSPYSMRTSQPAIEPLVVTLQGTERDTGLDLAHLLKLSEYFESISPMIRGYFDTSRASVVDTSVLSHQIPGGMASNLASQLKEADALDRIAEVYAELPRIRKEMGTPPLVTPTSQIIGTQAVSNVLFGRYVMVSGQIKDYVYGLYGLTPTPIDPEVTKQVLKDYDRGQEPVTGRAADFLEPEMDKAKEATDGLAKDIGDVLTYALYPVTGLRFLKWKYGLEPIPDEAKPKTLEQVKEQIAAEEELVSKAKAGLLVEKGSEEAAAITEPQSIASARAFNVYVGSERYQVQVESLSDGGVTAPAGYTITPVSPPPIAAPPAQPPAPQPAPVPVAPAPAPVSQVDGTAITAPMPGILIRYAVEVGQQVKKGAPVLFLEAMKMENSLPSPIDGTVKELKVSPGTWVKKNDVLAIIG
ncbi:MAG: pyruvate carboxylase subunit B [Chloroflexi bacterium]|nr:pyruvate carboxylase subunit B [Chloroflexota bacterium]